MSNKHLHPCLFSINKKGNEQDKTGNMWRVHLGHIHIEKACTDGSHDICRYHDYVCY